MKKIQSNYVKILTWFRKFRRKVYVRRWKRRLKNKDFTLVSNNCNGGVILKELGVKFNSQFINLNIEAKDYVEYLSHFDYYNSLDLKFEDNASAKFPIGKLEDLTIEFVHYKSEEEARKKWDERKNRINKNNIFVIFTEQESCNKQILEKFDALSFENKIVFTHKEYSDIKSSIYLEEYKNNPKGVHMFLAFKSLYSKKRFYDVFNWVGWFNGEKDLSKLKKL